MTRFKSNTPLRTIEDRPVPRMAQSSLIASDICLPVKPKTAKTPSATRREVRVRIETGKILRILSNDLDASAEEIAGLYKRRWEIELFFRWVKQTLKIKKFLGVSENAIRIQIAIALIAYLLLKLAHAAQKSSLTLLTFTRLVRSNLMHLKRIDRLLEDDIETPPDNSRWPSNACRS